ncbi:hypothetical protein NPIL_671921 [Nephila pilipes]|uniref:Uncharacterized protein n=1 Tax=Nephila pilipes TaxID=299642 RepID=A0A8X6NU61_NEPPI|nr:hypothetical protein NPIL_671921 [Nephila pilipes]
MLQQDLMQTPESLFIARMQCNRGGHNSFYRWGSRCLSPLIQRIGNGPLSMQLQPAPSIGDGYYASQWTAHDKMFSMSGRYEVRTGC